MTQSRHLRWQCLGLSAVLLGVGGLLGEAVSRVPHAGAAPAAAQQSSEELSLTPEQSARPAIAGSYYEGDYQGTIDLVDEFFRRFPISPDNFALMLFKAESHYRLNETDRAVQSYGSTLPFIEQLNNVQQRRFSYVYFRLGVLYRKRQQYDEAIRVVEAGLTREPQNIYYQTLLGELFVQRGEPALALKRFSELLAIPSLTEEERVVLRIKIARLSQAPPPISTTPATPADERRHPGFSFGIVPLNDPMGAASLRDICVLLESKWLVACQVLDPIRVDEAHILDQKRQQYDGQRILAELIRRYPMGKRPHRFVVAVTARDIFGPKTNYVFSWQDPAAGVAVVSAWWFLVGLEDFYEPDVMGTRRLGIQFLSTTSSLLGFTRPTRPDCPLAYPHDFQEFLQKRSKLCDSETQQRDDLLKKMGGSAERLDAKGRAEVSRVYRTYYFD